MALVSCSDVDNLSGLANKKHIYLLNNADQLVAVSIDPLVKKDMSSYEKVALVDRLLEAGLDFNNNLPVKAADIKLQNVLIFGSHVILDYSKEYKAQSPIEEMNFRSALVKSLTEFDDFSSVEITVNQGQLFNSDYYVGREKFQDVLLDYDEVTGRNESGQVLLYLPTEEKDKLRLETKEVTISANEKIEATVINALIDQDNQVLPLGVKLLNVYTHQGICFVDFSNEFKTGNLPNGISERLAIYSVVNSLSELKHIDKVQILVNGTVVSIFKESLTLNRIFTPNYALISQS